MQLSYLLNFSILVLVSANLCIGSTSTRVCSSRIANYDDLPLQLPAATPSPIGVYRGLAYNNLNLVSLGVLGVPPPAGVLPASSPNVGAFGVINATNPTNVTVKGGGAGYKSFTATRIAYGCVVASEQTAANVPASCTLAFNGYKAGVRVVRQFATYKVTGQLTQSMSRVKLAGFGGVDTVKFEIPVGTAVVAVLDNFEYDACT